MQHVSVTGKVLFTRPLLDAPTCREIVEIFGEGDRIVAAIEKASTDARESREGLIRFAANVLREVLAEGALRGIVSEAPPPKSSPRPMR